MHFEVKLQCVICDTWVTFVEQHILYHYHYNFSPIIGFRESCMTKRQMNKKHFRVLSKIEQEANIFLSGLPVSSTLIEIKIEISRKKVAEFGKTLLKILILAR